jgi:hypothetical protein
MAKCENCTIDGARPAVFPTDVLLRETELCPKCREELGFLLRSRVLGYYGEGTQLSGGVVMDELEKLLKGRRIFQNIGI